MTTVTVPTTFSTEADATRRSWLRAGVVASATAAVAAEGFALAARALDVPMRAADPGAASAKAIPVGGIAMAVLFNAAVGLLVAAALVRWAKAPAKKFALIAWTYAALSLLGPVLAAHTHTATKIVLTVTHLIAAIVIIPRVTSTLLRTACPGTARRG